MQQTGGGGKKRPEEIWYTQDPMQMQNAKLAAARRVAQNCEGEGEKGRGACYIHFGVLEQVNE